MSYLYRCVLSVLRVVIFAVLKSYLYQSCLGLDKSTEIS
jgi:hypothetical protein